MLKSKPSSPETRSWFEYIWKAEQEVPNRLEDAAKFLASMISISLTIFLAIGKSSFEHTQNVRLIISVVLWILSLIAAFFVLFPFRYPFVRDSVKSIKQMQKRIVAVKRWVLILSLAFFLAAIGILAYEFFSI